MSRRSGISTMQLLLWADITRSKYYEWVQRRGLPNSHNGSVPRGHWIQPWERELIVQFCRGKVGLEGYRRLTYMMLDENVVAVSPSTVYRVLKDAGMMYRWNTASAGSGKGQGFTQPTAPHQHWHVDISYINVLGTHYFLILVLDGFSRFILHHELRATMSEYDVELTLQVAHELHPDARPRVISDNGSPFISRDFRDYLRDVHMSHVRTSVAYPQSNGKLERVNRTIKSEEVRRSSYLSLEDARNRIASYIKYYNEKRLHSAIYYLAPKDALEGRAQQRINERQHKLDDARIARAKAA
jgi:transposase InsO family protein